MEYHTVLDSLTHRVWQSRPMEHNKMWYIQNAEKHYGDWHVTDVGFFKDPLCNEQIVDLQPATHYDEYHTWDNYGLDAEAAFDDEIKLTGWRLECGWDGCAARSAWLGAQLVEPQVVRCFSLTQPDSSSMARSVELHAYEISGWEHKQTYQVESTVWKSYPAENWMWRVAVESRASYGWSVNEVEFFVERPIDHRINRVYSFPCENVAKLDGRPEVMSPIAASEPG